MYSLFSQADVLVMRDVLEQAPNRSTAEAHMRADPNRTFAVFLGVGDYETQKLDIVGYRESDFHAYTDETMPDVTGHAYIKGIRAAIVANVRTEIFSNFHLI